MSDGSELQRSDAATGNVREYLGHIHILRSLVQGQGRGNEKVVVWVVGKKQLTEQEFPTHGISPTSSWRHHRDVIIEYLFSDEQNFK